MDVHVSDLVSVFDKDAVPDAEKDRSEVCVTDRDPVRDMSSDRLRETLGVGVSLWLGWYEGVGDSVRSLLGVSELDGDIVSSCERVKEALSSFVRLAENVTDSVVETDWLRVYETCCVKVWECDDDDEKLTSCVRLSEIVKEYVIVCVIVPFVRLRDCDIVAVALTSRDRLIDLDTDVAPPRMRDFVLESVIEPEALVEDVRSCVDVIVPLCSFENVWVGEGLSEGVGVNEKVRAGVGVGLLEISCVGVIRDNVIVIDIDSVTVVVCVSVADEVPETCCVKLAVWVSVGVMLTVEDLDLEAVGSDDKVALLLWDSSCVVDSENERLSVNVTV